MQHVRPTASCNCCRTTACSMRISRSRVVVAETLEAAHEAAVPGEDQLRAGNGSGHLEAGFANAYTPEKAGGGGDPASSHRGDMAAGFSAGRRSRMSTVYATPFQTAQPHGAPRHHRGVGRTGQTDPLRRDAGHIRRPQTRGRRCSDISRTMCASSRVSSAADSAARGRHGRTWF